jgi:hypothetical protein
MKMIRLTRLKSLGDSPLGLVPESVMRVATQRYTAEHSKWSYAHIRTTGDEGADDINNDEVHEVKCEGV